MIVNFGKQLLQTAQQFSDKTALVNVERQRKFTFMELHLLTNKICNMLKDRYQLKQGDIYGQLLENDNTSLFSLWSLKSNMAALSFNYRDSFDEHMYQIDYVKPKIIFVEKEIIENQNYYNAFRKRGLQIVSMDKLDQPLEGVDSFWDVIKGASEAEVNVEINPNEHITLYRFSGGTTGRGKCAMYTISNYFAGVHQIYSHNENLIGANTKMLHITPLSHATGVFILPVYFKGGTQYTINIPDLNQFCKVIEEYEITSTFAVPTLLYSLVDLGLENKYDLSSLEAVFYAASPMSPSKLEVLQERFGNKFVQGYGATEAWPFVTMLGKGDHIVNSEEDRKRLTSAGKPTIGVEIQIMDAEGIEVPIGSVGEIWIRGAAIIKGYYKAREETLSEFTTDGYWKSGDMGHRDKDGYIFIVDRKKDMIITGGFNVYATEVENAINSHPAVQQSVVIGIPHEKWGEAVHAEVILKDGMTLGEDELINYTKDKIGKYKVPKTIEFVTNLPMTAVGKVLRRSVRDKYWKEAVRKI